MSPHRCQVCGRRQPLISGGRIRLHHFRGQICVGSRRWPYAEAADALREALKSAETLATRYQARWDRHRQLRLNEPLSAEFWKGWSTAAREAGRLRRRLIRWSRRPLERAAA